MRHQGWEWALGVLVALFASGSPACASDLEVKSRIEPPGPYAIGDHPKFRWEISHGPKVKLESEPSPRLVAALAAAGFEATSVPETPATTGAPEPTTRALPELDVQERTDGDRKVITISASATTFTTGVHRVNSETISFVDSSGQRQKATTPEMAIPVQSALTGNPTAVKPLKDPLSYTYRFELPAWVWVTFLLFLSALAWAIHRVRRPKITPPPPPVPADQEAFHRIDVLLTEGILRTGQVKEFCDRLSDILRTYLGRRFGLSSMGETSDELLSALEKGGHLAGSEHRTLQEFLTECDLAKFARHRPEEARLMGMVDSARGLVTSTRPPAPSTTGTAAPPASSETKG